MRLFFLHKIHLHCTVRSVCIALRFIAKECCTSKNEGAHIILIEERYEGNYRYCCPQDKDDYLPANEPTFYLRFALVGFKMRLCKKTLEMRDNLTCRGCNLSLLTVNPIEKRLINTARYTLLLNSRQTYFSKFHNNSRIYPLRAHCAKPFTPTTDVFSTQVCDIMG